MRCFAAVLLLLAAVPAGCDSIAGPGRAATRIGWGTSFGECIGYCRTELDVTSSETRLVRSAWGLELPDRMSTQPTDAQTWLELRRSIQAAHMDELQDVYGCPDCADGGAEWVELEEPGFHKRVTFEYGHSPAQLATTVARLRALHDSLFPRLFASGAASAAGWQSP